MLHTDFMKIRVFVINDQEYCNLHVKYEINQDIFIRLSEKFLSFHKVIIDEKQFLFYIILLN